MTPLTDAISNTYVKTITDKSSPSETSTFRRGDPTQLLSTANLKNAVKTTSIKEGLVVRAKHLTHLTRGGLWSSTGLTAEDVMRAECLSDVAQDVKTGAFHKAQLKFKAKHSYGLEKECTGNEVTAVADVIFYGGLALLTCMTQPSTML